MNKKILVITLLLLSSFLIGGCNPLAPLLTDSVMDMTGSATDLIDELDKTIQEINVKSETGELDEEIADMTEEVLGTTLDQIITLLEENKGTLVGPANGIIDNIFDNISNQLDQIKGGYLDDSFPKLIEQLSTEMNNSVMRLSSETQDIIMLAAGSAFVAVDKATNLMITILSVVLAASGFLILTITLIRAKQKLSKTRIVGLVFGGIYTLFFLAILLVAPLRGYIITGFDYGVAVEAKALQAKITGISPRDFTLGEDDTITIFGNHLNLIEDLSVQLAQATEPVKIFDTSSIDVVTRYSIVISNLNKKPNGWVAPDYKIFENKVLASVKDLDKDQLSKISTEINTNVSKKKDIVEKAKKEETKNDSKVAVEPLNDTIEKSLHSVVDEKTGNKYTEATSQFFEKYFGISEGEYGVIVYSGEERIESPQHISLKNSTPPAPKPDIQPISMAWVNPAVVKERTSMRVGLKITSSTEIERPFKIKLTEISTGESWEKEVDLTTIRKADADQKCEVIISRIKPFEQGKHAFKVVVDSESEIDEREEGNNDRQVSLKVGEYVYDATVFIATFNPFKSYDDTDNEYRVTVDVGYSGEEKKRKHVNRNGRANKSYDINWTINYKDIKAGDVISIGTSGYEADAGTFYDSHDQMGSDTNNIDIKNDMTKNNETRDVPILLKTNGYEIKGNIRYTRRIK